MAFSYRSLKSSDLGAMTLYFFTPKPFRPFSLVTVYNGEEKRPKCPQSRKDE